MTRDKDPFRLVTRHPLLLPNTHTHTHIYTQPSTIDFKRGDLLNLWMRHRPYGGLLHRVLGGVFPVH